jgi:hypothetical protein
MIFMKNRLRFLATLCVSLSICFFAFSSAIALPAFAQTSGTVDVEIDNLLDSAGRTGFGYDTTNAPSLGSLIGRIVTAILGFTGTIAFLVFLYGGFLWLTARGNDDQVADAKKYLTNGTIGVVVIVLAYSAAYFITGVLYKAAR